MIKAPYWACSNYNEHKKGWRDCWECRGMKIKELANKTSEKELLGKKRQLETDLEIVNAAIERKKRERI